MKKKNKKPKTSPKAGKLIGRGEPPSVRVENARGKGRCLIVCDHASNRVPRALKNLGLSKKDLEKHIAWDPGTLHIGRLLGKKLDAPVVLSSYSRLVADLNRDHKNKECMRVVSDHIPIPGNKNLTEVQKKQRLDEIFWPYHRQIEALIKKFLARRAAPMLISIHSFTPEMGGVSRPWHIGLLWNKEALLAKRIISSLRRDNPRLLIGSNEPYSLKDRNFTKNTVSRHAESRGLPCVILEVRQDLVDTRRKAARWTEILLRSLLPVLSDPQVYKARGKKTAKRRKNNKK